MNTTIELLGQLAYEAYFERASGKSLATGATLPPWDDLDDEIKRGWMAAASAVRSHLAG